MPMTRPALIIEDDPTLAELVQLHLRDVDCEADIADDGVTGLEKFKEGDYELVVLDIMLPRKDGLSVCRDIRRLPGYVPILMLTAKSTEIDRVRGLETGADDYLTKPFSVRELVARVKALLRRVDALTPEADGTGDGEIIERGDMHIDVDKRRVTVNGEDIVLRVAFKPTSTIRKPQRTVDRKKQEVTVEVKGRHDPCVVPRAVPIVEAMAALVLVDQYLQHRGQTGSPGPSF